MKRMNYGTVPSYHEFEKAFDAAIPRGRGYRIRVNSSLAPRWEKNLDGDYTVGELYGLVKRLAKGSGPQEMFAGDILYTLEFEWV